MIGVTGANGLLGSFIVRKLLKENQRVVAFRRASGDISALADVNEMIEWRVMNIEDPVTMDDQLDGITKVIHAAARVSFNPRDTEEIRRVNGEGTRNLVNACLAKKISRFIFISSVAALGRSRGQKVVDENNKWLENVIKTPYATSKYLSELEVFRGQQEGLSAVILNPSVILGPADWNRSSARFFKYIWEEHLFYTGGTVNYVDARDVAAAAWMLMNSEIENERFIVSAGACTFKEFFEAIAVRLNKKPPRIKVGKNMLRIAAVIESIRSRITGSEPLITSETARLAGADFLYKNDKIKSTLDFEFRALEETLDWCCENYSDRFTFKKR